MFVVFAIGAVLLMASVSAATVLVFMALWRGLGDGWRRYPPAHRRPGVIAGGIMAVVWLAEGALVIAAPWGDDSFLYVVGFGNGALFLLVMVAGVMHTVKEARQATQRRSGP